MANPPESFGAGRFRVEGVLGEGGMGTVYEVTAAATGERAALKTLRRALTGEVGARARFEREARALFSCDHRNLLRAMALGREPDGERWLVTELVRGPSLLEVVNTTGPLELGRAARIGAQIADGLAAAHALGIVHRDVKPTNVLLAHGADGSETAKVIDFGIAALKATATYERLTLTGEIVGTPAFMAPEQLGGGVADERTDVYGLGALLYTVLAGRVPFTAPSLGETVAAIVRGDRPPLAVLRPDVGRLGEVVERAMSPDRAQRFSSMHDMRDALLRAVPSARALRSPTSASRSSTWVTAGAAAIVGFALAVGAAVVVIGAARTGPPVAHRGADDVAPDPPVVDAAPEALRATELAESPPAPAPSAEPDSISSEPTTPAPAPVRETAPTPVRETAPPADPSSSRVARVSARGSAERGDSSIPSRLARIRQRQFLACWGAAGGRSGTRRVRLSYSSGAGPSSVSLDFTGGIDPEEGRCLRELFEASGSVSGDFEGPVVVTVRV
ncbi:MAG: serine/threonine-protein kinase [Sandaracinaceae bacterium]